MGDVTENGIKQLEVYELNNNHDNSVTDSLQNEGVNYHSNGHDQLTRNATNKRHCLDDYSLSEQVRLSNKHEDVLFASLKSEGGNNASEIDNHMNCNRDNEQHSLEFFQRENVSMYRHGSELSEKAVISTEKIFLMFQGSFNPIHTRHIKALVLARTWLEENTHYEVIAGVLIPSSDMRVASKCRSTEKRYIKVYYRVQMCSIASYEYKWIYTCDDQRKYVKQVLGESNNYVDLSKVNMACVIGADRALNEADKIKAEWHSTIYVCVRRKGYSSKLKETFGIESGKVMNTEFYIVPEELDNVSSTSIRNMLQTDGISEKERRNIVQELVDKKWLYPDVGHCLNDFNDYMYNY